MPKVVLFVCVENTFRSILSEAIFNAAAPAGWLAESAGVSPADAINPLVFELLREIGIEVKSKAPSLVTREQIAAAERVITFAAWIDARRGLKESLRTGRSPVRPVRRSGRFVRFGTNYAVESRR